ncbi:GAF domain-containing sensor histidine kinase [Thalassotalea sp. LPB0316]|uniref:GAF domain-containing sensor histidine kinase n=1 Tax=Thalassotalea sp. LPB0316 TaxID=2769490 RepID=UPI001866525D|nr:GAF domain-containing sensor histidine kinase [Thalassotalea sp. LPB0316]QOL24878.1 GAF domain-containing sensor histidine kinase [Thalassotalea sp. LPB0316]
MNSLDYWKKAQQLEAGRNEVLRLVARNEPLEKILDVLCQKAKIYNPEMLCSILEFNEVSNTLHPKASVGLPEFYSEALDGVTIGPGVGSCGTAAFIKELVIVEDINTHPYWNQYKDLALSADVQACWSHPIIGAQGQLYGTYAIYYKEPKEPSEEDLKFIELNAYLATIVYDNHFNRLKILEQNKMLSQSLDERSQQLFNANQELNRLISEQQQAHDVKVSSEKSQTTNRLIAGFSHEISTPVNNAQVAIHSIHEKTLDICVDFDHNQITKQKLLSYLKQVEQLADISNQSLSKVNDLVSKFRTLNFNDASNDYSVFALRPFLDEVVTAKKSTLGGHTVSISCDDITINCQKDVLWQVFSELIDNAVSHGFTDNKTGTIHVHAHANPEFVEINFQDDGAGLIDNEAERIFEPFYTNKRHQKRLGLGLNLVQNALVTNLNGNIVLEKSPKGVRFKIQVPISPR